MYFYCKLYVVTVSLTTDSSIKCYNYKVFIYFVWPLNFHSEITTVILTTINLFESTIIL